MGRGGAAGGERGGGRLKPTLKHGTKVDLLGVGVTLFLLSIGHTSLARRATLPSAQCSSRLPMHRNDGLGARVLLGRSL